MRRLLQAVFAGLMLIMLSGCSVSVEEQGEAAREESNASESAMVMAAEEQADLTDLGRAENLCQIGDRFYYSIKSYDRDTESVSWEVFCREGDGEEKLILSGEKENLLCSVPDENGELTVLCTGEDGHCQLVRYDQNGEELFRKDADAAGDVLAEEGMKSAVLDAQGNLAVMTYEGRILLWDSQGAERQAVYAEWTKEGIEEGEDYGLVNAGTGLYAWRSEERSVWIQSLLAGEGKLFAELQVKLPFTVGERPAEGELLRVRAYSGYGDGIYLTDSDRLYRYDIEEKELEEVFAWKDPHVNLQPDFVELAAGDGKGGIALYLYDVFQNTGSHVTVKLTAESELAGQKVIELGHCSSIENLDDAVREFQKEYKEYRIEAVEYESSGQLLQDIARDGGPDILLLDGMTVSELVDKGVLQNLSPYLAESEKLSEEMLLPAVRETAFMDGGLRVLFSQFVIDVMVIQNGYTQDGAIDTLSYLNLPLPDGTSLYHGDSSYYQEQLLYNLVMADIENYVDWAGKSCSFDSEAFVELLEAVSRQKLPKGGSELPEAEQLYQGAFCSSFEKITNMYDYMNMKEAFSEFAQITCVPNQEGAVRYQMKAVDMLGINSASEEKEGAWKFLEVVMTHQEPEWELLSYMEYFSTMEARFEQQLAPVFSENFAYQFLNPYTMEVTSEQHTILPQDQEEVRRIVDNSTLMAELEYSTVLNIIQEEAAYCLKGDKTAQETAEIIQNRVMLLLQE